MRSFNINKRIITSCYFKFIDTASESLVGIRLKHYVSTNSRYDVGGMHVLILGFGSIGHFFPVGTIVAHKDSVVGNISLAGAVQKFAVIYSEIVECVRSLQVYYCVRSCRNIAPAEILVVRLRNTVNQI